MPRYAKLIYNGFWFSPEREMLQAAIDASQRYVSGEVVLKIGRGCIQTLRRSSPFSLYSPQHASFEEENVYTPSNATGFIRLNALRLQIAKRMRG